MAEKRVVSLIASATEIVCALDCDEMLVGRSHECDHPEWVRELPPCTEPKFAVEGTSYEIDARVKAVVQEGLSVYRVFADALNMMEPDLIITQSQCEVCAVSLRDVEEAVCQIIGSSPRIISLEPNALADVWHDIKRVADALEVPERGEALVEELQEHMKQIENRARNLDTKPRVACIEWIDPLMAGGNWMPTLVKMAGGENLFGEENKHSPWMQWEDLVAADPDVIVVLPCGWDKTRARQEMPPLTNQPEWNSLKAVKQGQVFLTDGNQYFNRPGPRLAESLEILAELFHPEVFDFGHKNIGWEKL